MSDVVIIGAGLTGLSAAHHLQSRGHKVQIVESSGKVGGRCKSDYIDGFILDRGLHFFQKDFSESKNTFDYRTLRLESIYPGIIVYLKNNFHLISNPIRKVTDTLSMTFSPFMTLKDKMNLASLMAYLLTRSDENIKKLKNISTRKFLEKRGFSEKIIDTFFRPLGYAAYLDGSLEAPAYVFASIMKFGLFGQNAIPAYGIGSIAVQLSEKLQKGTVKFHSKARNIHAHGVELASGEFIEAKSVIVTVPPHKIEEIHPELQSEEVDFNNVRCMYFATKTPPVNSPILLMNGGKRGLVGHIFVPTTIQRAYAPPGLHLINVTLRPNIPDIDEGDLIDEVLKELIDWFGIKVNDWTHLRTYHIEQALPKIEDSHHFHFFREVNDIYYCGDYMYYGSVNNALLSGRHVAKAVHLKLSDKLKTREQYYSTRKE